MDRPRRPEPIEPDDSSGQDSSPDAPAERSAPDAAARQQDLTDRRPQSVNEAGDRTVEAPFTTPAASSNDSPASRPDEAGEERPGQSSAQPDRNAVDPAGQPSQRDAATVDTPRSSGDATSGAQVAGDRVSAATRELMLQHPAFTRMGSGSGDASITEDQQPAVTGNADRALQIEEGRDEQATGDEPTADVAHREPTGSTVAVEATATESEISSDPSTDRSDASGPEPFGDPGRSSEDRAEPDAVPQQIAPQSDTPVLPQLSPLPEQTERSSDTDERSRGHADGGVQEAPAVYETVEQGDDAEDPPARAKITEQSIEIGREVVQPAGLAADESEGLSLAAIDSAPSMSPDATLERSLTSEDGDQLTSDVPVTTDGEAQRKYELGYDPAVKQFRPGETETALRIEAERGVQLERAQSADEKYDWVDSDGRTYDAIGNFPAKFLDRQWDNLKGKVEHHLEKADLVPIDVAKFTPEQRQRIRDTFAVYYPRVFIVGDDGFDGRND